MTVRMKALMPVFYGGQQRETDEEFDTVEDVHALALLAAGRAVKVETEDKPRNTAHPNAAINQRGRYKRRDMRAQK